MILRLEHCFPPWPLVSGWTRGLRLPFPVAVLAQGCPGGAVAEPDGAPGGGARRAGGADADGAVPHALGHHAVGLGRPVPRAAHSPPFRGWAPPAVSDLVLPHLACPESPGSPGPRSVEILESKSPLRLVFRRGEGPCPGELERGA